MPHSLTQLNAEGKKLLKSFFDSSHLMMGVVELRNGDLYHMADNDKTAQFYKLTASELKDKSFLQLGFTKKQVDHWISFYLKSKETKKPVVFEVENSGSHLKACVNYVGKGESGYDQYSYLVDDVTVFKKEHDALVEEKKKLEMITQNLGDVIWMTDPKKNSMVYISPAYERVWEKSCASLFENPRSFVDSIHPDDQERVIHAFPSQVLGLYNEIYRIITPDGQVKWILDRGFPIKNDQGDVYLVVGIASDISEKRKQDLLIQEQQAKIVATSKLSSLGEMAGGIAHEINNPLAIIQGKASLLLQFLNDGKTDLAPIIEGLNKIETTAGRIAKIIKGLSAFARNGEGEPLVPTSIRQIIEDTIELCKERFRTSDVDLQLLIEEDVQVHCRYVQISQVLLNLLTNAFDAVKGTPQPWVKLIAKKSQNSLMIDVVDSGKGIPAHVAEKIMEPFFTTKPLGQGTGLGLSISKGIIEDHSGKFWYDSSSPNTRFVITLPLSG